MSSGTPDATRLAASDDLPAPGSHVHLVGIGGAGMRGLALLLCHAGYRVSGCDQGGAEGLAELERSGIAVEPAHDAAHVEGVDLLVRSSAVPSESPEIQAAVARGVPILRRARALGALLNGRTLVGVAGTHGKTTITGMTGQAAETAGLDPVVLVGGLMPAWGGFARVGAGPAIVEADEYDRSFLELDPSLAIVSSLEPEHLDTYGDFAGVTAAYEEFSSRAIVRQGLLYCADDPGARSLASELGSGRSYGFDDEAWCRVERLGPSACRLVWPEGEVDLRLRVPGRHNQQNAAAAFCAALSLGGDPTDIARGLEAFAGTGRRLEHLGSWGQVTVVDDYAHHPTEVSASIAALRDAFPRARVTVVFQPHLFTRTRDFAAEFASALDDADHAWVLPIYPAREAPLEGVTADLIVEAGAGHVLAIDRDAARALASPDASRPHVVAYMGAGDVTMIAHDAAERLAGDAVGA